MYDFKAFSDLFYMYVVLQRLNNKGIKTQLNKIFGPFMQTSTCQVLIPIVTNLSISLHSNT